MMDITFGYTIFTVHDVAATTDFFTAAFGLERRFLTPEHDYGEMDTGQTTLAFVSMQLASDNLQAAGGFVVPHQQQPAAASITLVTEDVESAVDSAIAAGATLYVAAADKPWGQRVAYLLGPSSILVEVATPIST